MPASCTGRTAAALVILFLYSLLVSIKSAAQATNPKRPEASLQRKHLLPAEACCQLKLVLALGNESTIVCTANNADPIQAPASKTTCCCAICALPTLMDPVCSRPAASIQFFGQKREACLAHWIADRLKPAAKGATATPTTRPVSTCPQQAAGRVPLALARANWFPAAQKSFLEPEQVGV